MYSKKVALLVLGLVIGTSVFLSSNRLRIEKAFGDSIKQNVVYTQSYASDNNNDEIFKEKSLEILKKYFDESLGTNKNAYYYTISLNEKGLDEWEGNQLKIIQEKFEKEQISNEQYNKEKDDIKKQHEVSRTKLSKLKHGVIQATWFDGEKVYIVFFNENTREVEFALKSEINPEHNEAALLKASEEQLRNIAEDFIKQHKLGDIKNPKFIMFSGKSHQSVFYQEENDLSKKANIMIDPYTNKVNGFAVGTYADMFYNEIINEK